VTLRNKMMIAACAVCCAGFGMNIVEKWLEPPPLPPRIEVLPAHPINDTTEYLRYSDKSLEQLCDEVARRMNAVTPPRVTRGKVIRVDTIRCVVIYADSMIVGGSQLLRQPRIHMTRRGRDSTEWQDWEREVARRER
jgi:hypothetical protein